VLHVTRVFDVNGMLVLRVSCLNAKTLFKAFARYTIVVGIVVESGIYNDDKLEIVVDTGIDVRLTIDNELTIDDELGNDEETEIVVELTFDIDSTKEFHECYPV
jgi:biotin-(acetyl-CoA carboxylase) ligase